ncbi:hypothetical protein LTR37_004732 [Vermiconidia calcicola]|uniref:Uncharacterized protein n=1 Tax=Vermiconidia calcicola TaxID=1690605 RepID=A0ACC3NMK6_9PEZI|nr:hypothetical protein LTR37_004732 [Vermiconidia calcicola]
MDDANYLRCRNIQLETELRLVKEQLAQAQSGTQYLINCLSNQKSGHDQPIPAPDELRLHKAEADNLRLRRRLAFTQGVHGKVTEKLGLGGLSRARRFGLTQFQSPSPSPSTETERAQRNDSSQDDLLIYDGHEYSPNTTSQSSPADSFPRDASSYSSMVQSSFDLPKTLVNPTYADQDVSPTERVVQSFGLGIRGAQPSGQSSVHSTHHTTQQLSKASSYGTPNNYNVVARQIGKYASSQSQPGDPEPQHIGEWRAICSPPPADCDFVFHSPFLNVEHNRLLGAAFFIEEMSEDEKAEHWERLAFEKGRHSAKEWQTYYEEMVRPEYLAKVGRREAAGDTESGLETTFPVNNAHGVSASGFSANAAAKENHEALLDAPPQLGPGAEGSLITVTCPKKEANPPASLQDQVTPSAPLGLSTTTTEPSSFKEDECDARVANMVENDGGSCSVDRHSHTGEQLPTSTSILRDENHATDTPALGDFKPTTENPPTASQVLSGYPTITPLPSQAPAFDRTLTPALPSFSRADTPVRRSPRFSQCPTEASEILHDIDNEDEGLFHTVIISNIPATVQLSNIVAKVRGGRMLSATFLATACMKTIPPLDTNATLIVFSSAQRAKAYADFCQQDSIFFDAGEDDSGQARATVQMIRTPTMSMHPRILFKIRERGLTRVLFIIDAQHKWTAEQVVEQVVRRDWNLKRPLVAGRDEDGILFFEFADVREAAAAWRAVDRDRWYFDGASKGFLPDPCDRPLETLREVDDVANMVEDGNTDGNNSSDGSDGEDTVVDTPATTANNSFAPDRLESERKDDDAGDL